MTTVGRSQSGGEIQPQNDAAKITQSDKFQGRHVRIETDAKGLVAVSVDSTVERKLRELVSKFTGSQKPQYATHEQKITVLNRSIGDGTGAKKIENILAKDIARGGGLTDVNKHVWSDTQTKIVEAEAAILDKLGEKNPVVKILNKKLEGSHGERLSALKEYGVNLKSGEINAEKFSAKVAEDIQQVTSKHEPKDNLQSRVKAALGEYILNQGLSGSGLPANSKMSVESLFSPSSYPSINQATTNLLALQNKDPIKFQDEFKKASPEVQIAVTKQLINQAKSDPAIMKMLLNTETPVGKFFEKNCTENQRTEFSNFIQKYLDLSENPSIQEYEAVGKDCIYEKTDHQVNINTGNRNNFETAIKEKNTAKAKVAMENIKNELLGILHNEIGNITATPSSNTPTETQSTVNKEDFIKATDTKSDDVTIKFAGGRDARGQVIDKGTQTSATEYKDEF